MELKFAIVHDLQKKAGQMAATSKTRDNLLKKSDSLTNLFESLHLLYKKKSTKGFGRFDSDTETYRFSVQLENFYKNPTDSNFVNFTTTCMGLFTNSIKAQNLATGGFILFIWYIENSKSYLFITMLRQTIGCVITDSLEIDEAKHLQMDKLHTGCQIDIETWKEDPQNQYITFIKGISTQTTPLYFLNAIGCDEFANSAHQTNELIRAINDYAASKNLNHSQKQELKQKVFDFCSSRENVPLDSLSQFISSDEQPQEFMEFLNQGDYKIGNGFEPHTTHLKKLKEIKASGEGIQLRFPADMLGTRVQLDANGRKLTINNPPESIVRALKEESK